MKNKLVITLLITLVLLITSIVYTFSINEVTNIYTMILVIISLILTSTSLIIFLRNKK